MVKNGGAGDSDEKRQRNFKDVKKGIESVEENRILGNFMLGKG